MNLSERTASLAGRPLPGSRLATVQAEISRPGITLRFADIALEADYLLDRASGCAAQARGGLLLFTVLMVGFQLLDLLALGMHYPRQVTHILIWVLTPVFVIAWVCMRLKPCKPWIVPINITTMVIAGLTLAWVIPQMVITADRPPYANESLLLYVAVIYFLSGAMFHAALSIGLSISAVFILSIAASKVDFGVVVYSAFFLVAFNLVCAIGRYMLDKTYRRNFLTRMIAVELAERDPLTGIYNRRVFEDRLDILLRQSLREQSSLTVLALDIDNFKAINDSGGHALGDTALCALADALQDIVRHPLDCIARLGGDEFAALWMGLPPEEIEGRIADLTARFATRSAALTQRLGTTTTLSMGIAHANNTDGYNKESLLQAADAALYRAKAQGRARAEIQQLPPLQSAPQPL